MTLKQNQKGFTLIELMIVIAIIGILAAIAIPNYISFRDKGYCSSAESDASSILGTLADYYAIPSHTGNFGGLAIPAVGGAISGITWKALSNGNTAALAAAGSIHTVTVTDVSVRCPLAYRTSQSTAGWTLGAGGTFVKSM